MKRLTGIAVLLSLMLSPAVFGRDNGREGRMAREKSRHYYLSGAHKYAGQEYDVALELFRHAYMCDTTNGAAALEYAVQYTPLEGLAGVDSVLRERLLRSGRGIVESNPSDFYTVYNYSMLSAHAGRTKEAIEVMERFRELNPGHTEGLEVLNDLYLDEREFDKSLEVLEKYERIKGSDIKLTLRKSAVYIAKGDSAGAIQVTKDYISERPEDPQSWVLKGQIEQYLHRPDSAMASYNRAVALSGPGNGGPAYIQLAQLQRELGDSTEYDRNVYEALLSEDLNVDIKKDLLRYYVQTQIADSAADSRSDRLMNVLLQQYPHEPDILSLSSEYNAYRKNYDKSLEDIIYCIDLEPNSQEYRSRAMYVAYFAEQYEMMDSIYREAVEYFPNLPLQFSLEYIRMLSGTSREKEAIAQLKTIIGREFPGIALTEPLNTSSLNRNISMERLDNLTEIFQIAADSYSTLKTYPTETAVCYDNVLLLNPDDPLVLNNYAYFLVRDDAPIDASSLEKALQMSERAMTADPGNPTYMDTRAWALYRSGDAEAAREIQQSAIEIELGETDETDEAMEELYSHYADILQALGQTEEARQYYRKVLEISPDREDIKLKLKTK